MPELLENFYLPTELPRSLEDVRLYGTQTMAYSALQNGIQEFRHEAFDGFVPYMNAFGEKYVLSDPIVPPEQRLKATMLFLQAHRNPVFCQISQSYAMLLSHLRFSINGFGIENIIDLDEFKVSWRRRKCLKSYLSKLEKQNYFVFEQAPDNHRVWSINRQWLSARGSAKELTFLARPFRGILEQDVRVFYLLHEKEMVGFCTFDPVYAEDASGMIQSYALQHLRVADGAPLGSQDFLLLHALRQFKEEDLKDISLGLSPLYKRENLMFKHSHFAEAVFKLIYRWNAFYNYRTIGQHKDHYKGMGRQTFIASARPFTLKQLCGLLKVNNLI